MTAIPRGVRLLIAAGLAAWVLTSGLTLEDAALIQPGYYWPAGQFDTSAYQPSESALEKT